MSPILNSEDDCQEDKKEIQRKIILKLVKVKSFQLFPWIDATEFSANNSIIKKSDIEIQTQNHHAPLIDKYFETEMIDYEV